MKKFINIFAVTALVFSFSLNTFAADTEEPSDVENLKAEALNGAVKLTWDKAKDNTAVTGYQVYYGLNPVKKTGEEYDEDVNVKDVTTYTVDGLENGKKYYFSVIAYDAEKNESPHWATGLNGAIEISATPNKDSGSAEDKTAPTVKSAEAIYKDQVKVEFSEEIVLTKDDPQDAFTIENDDTLELLKVVSAEMDEEDDSNSTVILTTDEQKENQDYKLTVGIDIKDKANNSIVSGTSDTAKFTGTDKVKEDEEPEDKQAPKITKVESGDNTHVTVSFDETIVLSIDPSKNFTIYQNYQRIQRNNNYHE